MYVCIGHKNPNKYEYFAMKYMSNFTTIRETVVYVTSLHTYIVYACIVVVVEYLYASSLF